MVKERTRVGSEPYENHLSVALTSYEKGWAIARMKEIFLGLPDSDRQEVLGELNKMVASSKNESYPLYFVKPNDKKVFDYIYSCIEEGRPPSFVEIAREVGFSAASSARKAVLRLANVGVLDLELGSRGFRPIVEPKQVWIKEKSK